MTDLEHFFDQCTWCHNTAEITAWTCRWPDWAPLWLMRITVRFRDPTIQACPQHLSEFVARLRIVPQDYYTRVESQHIDVSGSPVPPDLLRTLLHAPER